MAPTGGPAALRGYRLQSLYGLDRMLTCGEDQEHLRFRFEGLEDVEVSDVRTTEVDEYVQVKAYSSSLTLSDIDSAEKGATSVLRRALGRIKSGQGNRQRIVSVGTIGPELAAAWKGKSPHRERVEEKLSSRYSTEDIDALFAGVELEELTEDALSTSVVGQLRGQLVGGDPDVAFQLLSFWIHLRSEAQDLVSAEELRAKITSVGRYLAERATHHQEWFTSIHPLVAQGSSSERAELEGEFYQGISARFDHIVASVDVPRPKSVAAIGSCFDESPIAIVHGPSGQGKSALAYRYLHDQVPESLRFEVRSIADLRQAQSIAQALLGHAKAIGVPIYVYVDVQPSDVNWIEIVARLARDKNIRILVTVREEDWTKAGALRDRLQYTALALSFDREEAAGVFEQLLERGVPKHLVSFEDAWERFGCSGPLLEFVYLVVQDISLSARLAEQVATLERELDATELDFLRVASVGTAYGASLDLRTAAQELKLGKPELTVKRLQREYLVRSSSDGRLIEALHPVRSEFLAELLTDPALHPRDEAARRASTVATEGTLEVLGLHVLSRHWDSVNESVEALLQLRPRSWVGVGAVLQVLLWYAIRRHIERNHRVLQDAYDQFGRSAWLVLGWDVTGLGKYPDLRVRFEEVELLPEKLRESVASFRSAATGEQADFEKARQWLELDHALGAAESEAEWAAVARVAFWAGHWGLKLQHCPCLARLDAYASLEALPLEAASEVLLGLSFLEDSGLEKQLAQSRSVLLERFRAENRVVWLEDDGHSIRAHFMLGVESSVADGRVPNADEESLDLHAATNRVLEILRGLFPECEGYGCQGYGHTPPGVELPFDPTHKTGVRPQYLLPRWPTSFNRVFGNLAEYEHRPNDWGVYCASIADLRRENLELLEQVRRAAARHFKSKAPQKLIETEIDADRWDGFREALRSPPSLPQVAVDEWGFAGEGKPRRPGPLGADSVAERLAIGKYDAYVAAKRDFLCPLSNFYNQAGLVLTFNPSVGRASKRAEREAINAALGDRDLDQACRLSVHNLLDALRALPKFQQEIRQRFAMQFPSGKLERLERRERTELEESWALWSQFALNPRRVHKAMDRQAVTIFEKEKKNLAVRLGQCFGPLKQVGIIARVTTEPASWEGKPAIWVTYDTEDPELLGLGAASVFQQIDRALRPKNSMGKQAALALTCQHVVVVPLLHGRPVDRTVQCIPWSFLASTKPLEDFLPLICLPQEVPATLWAESGLEAWSDRWGGLPEAELYDRTVELYRCLAYLQCVKDIPDADEAGKVLLKAMAAAHGDRISELFGKAHDRAHALLKHYAELPDHDLEKRPRLSQAVADLQRAWSGVCPKEGMDGIVTFTQDDLAEWFERFSRSLEDVWAMRLALVAERIEREAPAVG